MTNRSRIQSRENDTFDKTRTSERSVKKRMTLRRKLSADVDSSKDTLYRKWYILKD